MLTRGPAANVKPKPSVRSAAEPESEEKVVSLKGGKMWRDYIILLISAHLIFSQALAASSVFNS